MTTLLEHVTLMCSGCGSNKFSLPNQPPCDEDMVSCADCGGEIGTYGDIRVSIRAAGPILDCVPLVP